MTRSTSCCPRCAVTCRLISGSATRKLERQDSVIAMTLGTENLFKRTTGLSLKFTAVLARAQDRKDKAEAISWLMWQMGAPNRVVWNDERNVMYRFIKKRCGGNNYARRR